MATAAQMLPPPRWTLRPLETGAQILARLAHLVEPKERLSVSQWVERHDAFDLEALPWQAEPMDALSDPETAEVATLGPAQAGKTTIGLSWAGWVIDQDPGDFLLCQPDKNMTHNFVATRLNPFLERISTLRRKLIDNPIFLKQLQGMFIASIWPVPQQFAQRPARYGWLDDFDQMDEDIGGTEDEAGQGSAITLLDGRQTTFKGRDTKLVTSSPADERGGKTEAFVETGTDERLEPECPSCGDRWQVDLSRDLRFDDKGAPEHAAATAHVICGANGCLLKPEDRRALLQSLKRLPNRGFVAVRPEAGKRRRTFRIDGLMAFTTWDDLARQWREAQIAWADRQDEGPLRTFFNTKAGKNYRSILSGEKPLKVEDLAKRREPDFRIGTVPAGVKVIFILVDAQATSFECLAVGFGDKLESWIIDRWSIHQMEDGTPVRPFSDPNAKLALLPLWSKRWPLADGTGQSPVAISVGLDTGGGGGKNEDSWTESAKALWHLVTGPVDRGGLGLPRARITLLKGGNNPKASVLMPQAQFQDRKMRGGAKRNSPDLWMPNVHRLKNVIDVRLRKEKPGPGYIHLPGADRPGRPRRRVGEGGHGIEDEHLDELTAEELKDGRWKKMRARNETWDLVVYAYALMLRPPFAQSRDHMRWVPEPFRVPDQAVAVLVAEGAANDAVSSNNAEVPPEPWVSQPTASMRRRKPARPNPYQRRL